MDDLKKMQDLKVRQLETTIDGLEEEGRQKDGLIAELKNNIDLLRKEVKET